MLLTWFIGGLVDFDNRFEAHDCCYNDQYAKAHDEKETYFLFESHLEGYYATIRSWYGIRYLVWRDKNLRTRGMTKTIKAKSAMTLAMVLA